MFFTQMIPLLILLHSHQWTTHPMHYKFNQINSFLGSPKSEFTQLWFHSNQSSLNSDFKYVDYTHPKHIFFTQISPLLILLHSHQWTTHPMYYKFNQINSFVGSPKSEFTQPWFHSNQSSLNSDFQYVDYTHPKHIVFTQISPLLILLHSHQWNTHPVQYKFNHMHLFLGSPKSEFTPLWFHSNQSCLLYTSDAADE